MDKCREEFEKKRYWIGLFKTGVDFDVTLGEFGRYISNGSERVKAMDLDRFNEKYEVWAAAWQHQQAKVEGLQRKIDAVKDLMEMLEQDDSVFLIYEELEKAHKGEG